MNAQALTPTDRRASSQRWYAIGPVWILVLIMLAVPTIASAYVQSRTQDGEAVSWVRRCIPFHVNNKGSDDLSLQLVLETIQRSLGTWSDVSCADVEFFYQGETDNDFVGFLTDAPNINMVIFRETPSEWLHSKNIIALTTVTFCEEIAGPCEAVGQIVDADIELNGAYHRFSATTPVPSTRFDLENSVTHELGHLLGFDHSFEPDATRYESAPTGESLKRDLADDDELGLCTVYPAGARSEVCEPFDVDGPYFPGPGVVAEDIERSATTPSGCMCAADDGAAGLLDGWIMVSLLVYIRRRWLRSR
ncbi:MAG: matrixin family metalloprotease [Myxococcota bacterium]|nr:matrixin family metalloprotease [Myxococcota bacterium]